MASAWEAGVEVAEEARLGPVKPCHPALMRTRVCRYFRSRGGRCRRGDACPYAHGDADLRRAPDLTKTALCLLFMEGACPCSAEECKFAHGLADKRSLKAGGVGDGRRRARQPPANQSQGEGAEAARRRGGQALQGSGLRAEDLIQLRSRTGGPDLSGPHTGSLGKDVFDDVLDTASTTDGSNRASSEPSPGEPGARLVGDALAGAGREEEPWGKWGGSGGDTPASSEREEELWGRWGGSGGNAPASVERKEEPWRRWGGSGGNSTAGIEREEEPWRIWGGRGGDAPAGAQREEELLRSWGGSGGNAPAGTERVEEPWRSWGSIGLSPPSLLAEAEGRTPAAYMVPDLRSVLPPEALQRLLLQAAPSCYCD